MVLVLQIAISILATVVVTQIETHEQFYPT